MSIDVQQPRPYDLVTNAVQIAGVAGGAFEATFNYRIHEGHDEVTGFFTAGDGIGGTASSRRDLHEGCEMRLAINSPRAENRRASPRTRA